MTKHTHTPRMLAAASMAAVMLAGAATPAMAHEAAATPTAEPSAGATAARTTLDDTQRAQLERLVEDTHWWEDESGFPLDTAAVDDLSERRERIQTVLDGDGTDDPALLAAETQDALTRLRARLLDDTGLGDDITEHGSLDPALYTPDTWDAYDTAVADAAAMRDTYARTTRNEATTLHARIGALRGKLATARAYTADGAAMTATDDGWHADLRVDGGALPDTVTVTNGNGATVATLPLKSQRFESGDKLGVGDRIGEYSGTGRDGAKLTATVRTAAGAQTTAALDDGAPAPLTRDDTGEYTTTLTAPLGTGSDYFGWDTARAVTLSDGTTLTNPTVGECTARNEPLMEGQTALTGYMSAKCTVTYTGRAAGGETVRVDVNATRTYAPALRLTLTATGADGKETTIWQSPMESGLRMNDVTLPSLGYDKVGDRYQITAAIAEATDPNVRDVTVRTRLGDNGARLFDVTFTVDEMSRGEDGATTMKPVTRTVTVTQPFDAPPANKPNGQAVLTGFLVNGKPMDGFSADRTDYVIRAKQGEKVVVPQHADDVTVATGPSRQTAYTTVQTWDVTGPDGAHSTYTVTLIRDHDTPTADEAFTPPQPAGAFTDKENPSETNTDLYSVGYTVDGKYTPVNRDSFTIPEGGVLSWEAYAGQVVQATGERVEGMTWRYRLGVLAADQSTYAERTVTVTYLTAATHKAQLDNIRVDGADMPAFDPERTEYTVGVENPERYTVTPVFDKQSGMSVTVDKSSERAILTAVSADGLTRRVYTVRIVQATETGAGTDMLAETGTAAGAAAGASLLAALAGIALLATRRRRAR
ncbi:hypothetical protein [Bifidobacterium castoris]|uniref:Cell surface protein n=1 Tax=Bifidobacterium castoris TaxID=2306972 RepID=A0A430FAK1_9BIFI|nr:hypothetical protein [Bifidobacterium castoris]RSX49864.1 cell surface protein [Bifidobacterium castoris]